MRYIGELPQQMDAKLTHADRPPGPAPDNESATRTAEERKVFLEAQISLIGKSVPGISQDSAQSPEMQLAAKKAKLADLTSRYTEMVPEVIRTKQEVAESRKADRGSPAVHLQPGGGRSERGFPDSRDGPAPSQWRRSAACGPS